MRIVVVGAGGVGGYFGGRLAMAGEDVTFVVRGANLAALRSGGLRLDTTEGDSVIQPIQASDDPASLGQADLIILGVKTWQIPGVAQSILPLVGPKTAVLSLQNGVEAPGQIAAVVGADHVLGGVARVFSYVVEPGWVRQRGAAPSIIFGELGSPLGSGRSQRARQLLACFQKAGVNAEIAEDITRALWEKLLLVAPMGAIGAVTRAPFGIMRGMPETRQLIDQGMREIYAVAQALGIAMDNEIVERTFALIDRQPENATTSLQRDIMAGLPSELDAWSGAVVRLGQQARIATPLNSFLHTSLLPQERQARGEVQFPA